MFIVGLLDRYYTPTLTFSVISNNNKTAERVYKSKQKDTTLQIVSSFLRMLLLSDCSHNSFLNVIVVLGESFPYPVFLLMAIEFPEKVDE